MKKVLSIIIVIMILMMCSSSSFANQPKKDIVVAVVGYGIYKIDVNAKNKIWCNHGEIPNNEVDDDNNGYIDDICGWNFAKMNNNVLTDDYKETHETAVIEDLLNYDDKYVHKQSNVRIMPVRIWDDGEYSKLGIKEVAEYAINNGADIISLSIEFDMDNPEIIDEILKEHPDVLLVRSAGNRSQAYGLNKRNTTGNSHPNCIVAGALYDNSNYIAYYSNYGDGVDVYASGVCHSMCGNILYDKMMGTSFAVPKIVSQCIKIMNEYPDAKPKEVKERLKRLHANKKALLYDRQE